MTQKYKSPCPPPTDYENEILQITTEECAEVIQRITKAQRFGMNEIEPGQNHTNSYRLGHEIGNLLVMVDKLKAEEMILPVAIENGAQDKRRKLLVYMQTEKPE